jgi:hypothetical protein
MKRKEFCFVQTMIFRCQLKNEMKIHIWNERKAHTHTRTKKHNKKYVQGTHIYIYKETYSYLGTATVQMDEVCARPGDK